MSGDSRVSDLANELKLKSFETERLQLVHEETVKNLKESQLDVEKLQKKTEVSGVVTPSIWTPQKHPNAQWITFPTLDHEVAGSDPARGRIQLMTVLHFIA